MMPWEREIYLGLLQNHVKEQEKQRKKMQQNVRK